MELHGMNTINDNFYGNTYSRLMAEETPHIILKIDFKEPIELGDFVATFTAVGDQFERYVRSRYPDLKARADVFVKEIRPGSIEADFVSSIGSLLGFMEHAVVVREFVEYYGMQIAGYVLGKRTESASRSDLNDFLGTVTAIAKDPDARSTIQAAVFEDGEKKVRAAFTFSTPEARKAAEELEGHRRALEAPASTDYQRVLMAFFQSNIKDTDLGQRTGEWVLIEEISERPLPLIYASALAEQRIKDEIRESTTNLYKKGFVVDVNVQLRGGRQAAYRVVNVHQVIDLPD